MDTTALLEEIYNDISFDSNDLELIKNSTNKFLETEMEKIKKNVYEFTQKEISKLKEKKIDRFNKNINTITENTLRNISTEYNLNVDEVLEKNQNNLLEIKDFNNLNNQDYICEVIEEDSTEESNSSNKTQNTLDKPVLDKTTENQNYKNHLISQNKCPAFVKGKYCEKVPKHGHYCGYHKKFA